VAVPILWDRQRPTIVNNEPPEIIRVLSSEFDDFGDPSVDFYPADLRAQIDAINPWVYDTVNNGAYRAGFAIKQPAYEQAYEALFATLNVLEDRLDTQPYIAGDRRVAALQHAGPF
jgi:glutathionyl-hydroquinone reductase